jgi:hypothetical protein
MAKKDPAGEGGARDARRLLGGRNTRAGRNAYEVNEPDNPTERWSGPKADPPAPRTWSRRTKKPRGAGKDSCRGANRCAGAGGHGYGAQTDQTRAVQGCSEANENGQ